MGFFMPKWKSNNYDKAIKAARKVTDNNKLKAIALEAANNEIRIDAVSRITSQDILKELASCDDERISSTAISRIDDRQVLKELAISKEEHVSSAAISRINDVGILKELAVFKGSAKAMKKIGDPSILAEIIASNAQIAIICQAIDKINDPEMLKAAFFRTDRKEVKKAIWEKLPLDAALFILTKENYSKNEICEKMGAHCNAPGPKSHFIEPNFEEGFYEHELICCKLCGKPLWHRQKHTAVWDKNWEGGYIDFQKYSDWELQGGEWKAKNKSQYGSWITIPTKDLDGCYEE